MLRIVESKKPLKELAADLEKAVVSHKFGILGVHDLKAKMAEKGVAFARECRIYEVCNPHQAKKVLEANLEISTALPCRISLYEEGGRTNPFFVDLYRLSVNGRTPRCTFGAPLSSERWSGVFIIPGSAREGWDRPGADPPR